jgi:hypothetical protein
VAARLTPVAVAAVKLALIVVALAEAAITMAPAGPMRGAGGQADAEIGARRGGRQQHEGGE